MNFDMESINKHNSRFLFTDYEGNDLNCSKTSLEYSMKILCLEEGYIELMLTVALAQWCRQDSRKALNFY